METTPSDPRWLDDDEMAAWLRLVAVVELLPGVLDGQLRTHGLTHFEYHVLAVLSSAPESLLRMSELAAQTSATLPRLSHVVRRMSERDLVERRASPDDGRATDVALTPTGRDLLDRAAPGHVAVVRERVLDRLTRAQVRQLRHVTDVLLTGLDPRSEMSAFYAPTPSAPPRSVVTPT